MKMKSFKLLGALALIATSASCVLGGTNAVEVSAGANFNNSNFTVVGGGWSLAGTTATSTSTIWTPGDEGNFLIYNNTPSLRKTSGGSWYYDYVVSTTFKSSTNITSYNNGEEQFRGILIYYVDINNYLMVNAKWERDRTSSRPNVNEIAQYTLYGEINGVFAETTWTDQWVSTEWREEWADNPNNNAELNKDVKMSVHVYNRSKNNISDDTDCIDITVECGNNKATKTNIFGYRSPFKYALNTSPITSDQVKVGLFSRTTNGEAVTYSDFSVAQINPTITESGTRVTSATVGETITLPTYTASNGVESKNATVSVLDPENNPVTLNGSSFVASKVGEYTVNVSAANDSYGNAYTPITYKINVSGTVYDVNEEGTRVTTGERGVEITLPTYTATTGTDNIPLTVSVSDPDNNPVTLTNNKFTPTKVGTYNVKVKSATTTYYVNEVNYSIQVGKQKLQIVETGNRITVGEVGSEISLPTYSVSDTSVTLNVEVSDPSSNPVTLTNNKFTPTVDGTYRVKVSYTGDYYEISSLQYDIVVNKKTYEVKITGEQIKVAKTGSTVTLPTFTAGDDNVNVPLMVKVTAPDGSEVTLTNNSFVAEQDGKYVVEVKSADATYLVKTLRYEITVNEAGEIPLDPNSGTIGYGEQSQVVYVVLISVISASVLVVVASLLIYKFVIARKGK